MTGRVVNLATVREERASRRTKLLDRGQTLIFECHYLSARPGPFDGVAMSYDLSDIARATVQNVDEFKFLVSDADGLLGQVDTAIARLACWRAALRTAITEMEDGDPSGGAA